MPRVNVKGLDEEQLRLEFVANPPDIPVHTSIIAHAIEQFALAEICSFARFKRIWKNEVITSVPADGLPERSPIKKMRQLYEIARSYLNPAYTFFHRVGAIFSFYLLYQTQIPDPKRPIPVTYHQTKELEAFRAECVARDEVQPFRADELLRLADAYVFVADGSVGATQPGSASALEAKHLRLARALSTTSDVYDDDMLTEWRDAQNEYISTKKPMGVDKLPAEKARTFSMIDTQVVDKLELSLSRFNATRLSQMRREAARHQQQLVERRQALVHLRQELNQQQHFNIRPPKNVPLPIKQHSFQPKNSKAIHSNSTHDTKNQPTNVDSDDDINDKILEPVLSSNANNNNTSNASTSTRSDRLRQFQKQLQSEQQQEEEQQQQQQQQQQLQSTPVRARRQRLRRATKATATDVASLSGSDEEHTTDTVAANVDTTPTTSTTIRLPIAAQPTQLDDSEMHDTQPQSTQLTTNTPTDATPAIEQASTQQTQSPSQANVDTDTVAERDTAQFLAGLATSHNAAANTLSSFNNIGEVNTNDATRTSSGTRASKRRRTASQRANDTSSIESPSRQTRARRGRPKKKR